MSEVTDIDHSWQQLSELSSAIYRSADEQQWETVAELAEQRHRLVKQHFEQFPVGPDTAEFYYSRLNRLLSDEQQLQATAQEARKQLMRLGAEWYRGDKAARAYARTANG